MSDVIKIIINKMYFTSQKQSVLPLRNQFLRRNHDKKYCTDNFVILQHHTERVNSPAPTNMTRGNNPVMGYNPTGNWDRVGVILGTGIIAVGAAVVIAAGVVTTYETLLW